MLRPAGCSEILQKTQGGKKLRMSGIVKALGPYNAALPQLATLYLTHTPPPPRPCTHSCPLPLYAGSTPTSTHYTSLCPTSSPSPVARPTPLTPHTSSPLLHSHPPLPGIFRLPRSSSSKSRSSKAEELWRNMWWVTHRVTPGGGGRVTHRVTHRVTPGVGGRGGGYVASAPTRT